MNILGLCLFPAIPCKRKYVTRIFHSHILIRQSTDLIAKNWWWCYVLKFFILKVKTIRKEQTQYKFIPKNGEDSLVELNWIAFCCGFRRRALWSESRLRQLRFFSSNSDRLWNLKNRKQATVGSNLFIIG